MSNRTKVSIPQPCHENWQQMTPAVQGRFCAGCQKSVIDFTNLSDREIVAKISSGNNICGRFRASQLDRQLMVPKEKSAGWMAAASGVLALLGSSANLQAQVSPTEQLPVTVRTSDDSHHTIGKIAPPESIPHAVTGVVSDAIGPIPGANIVIKGTSVSTQTDIDGKFKIKAKQGDVLIASYVGMLDANYVISDHFNGIIISLESSVEMNDLVMSGAISVRRSFFGSLFHSIGNWFR